MKPFCLVFILLACCAGCATTTPVATADKPPRYASRVQVARYDATERSVRPEFAVYADAASVPRPYRIIALVSHNANPEDQALMMQAIAWRARQLGADGMIVLPPISGGWHADGFGTKSKEPVFSAHAIIFTP